MKVGRITIAPGTKDKNVNILSWPNEILGLLQLEMLKCKA